MATQPTASAVPPLLRVLAIVGIVLAVLAVVILAALAWLDTGSGRAFVAGRIESIAPESGLRVRVGDLEGSIYGRLVIRDLEISDPKGVFATSPRVVLDWRPASLVRKHVVVRTLSADTLRVLRLPALNEVPDTGEPILPDIDIDVGRLAIERIILEPPVAGRRQVVQLTGTASIADRRAQVVADARAVTGGDRLSLRLDAAPDNNRFDVDARLDAPVGGVVAGLAGLDRPLKARVNGDGSWQRWSGTAAAQVGGAPLLDVDLTAQDGRFGMQGRVRPALLLGPGAVARLTDPMLEVVGTATAADRRVQGEVRATSAALEVVARGVVDLGAGRFEGVAVDARLLRPTALFDEARGRDIRLSLAVDGPTGSPTVGYTLTAAAIGFGETLFEGLRATGQTVYAAEPLVVPIDARAARVLGVNAAVGGLLADLRVTGRLRMADGQILSDDLRIRSVQLDATAVLAYTLATGAYDVALKGAVSRYQVAGLGVLDLTSDARVVPDGRGGLRLRGTVRARAANLESAGLRDFLGGLPQITAEIERTPEGTILIRNGRLRSPKFRVDNARGAYRADGTLTLVADALSTDYGPLTISAEGPATRPRVRIRAARPNVGIQLSNVDALLTPTGAGYGVAATGGSPYGPFSFRGALNFGAGPLSIDIASLQLAGITARGRLVQTAAGPYAGNLALVGQGLTGTARLSAAGAVQRVDLTAQAARARLALATPVTIARGGLTAAIVMTPGAPQVVANGSFEGVRQGALAVRTARVGVDYRGGRGRASITADGRHGAPFTVAADAAFAPDRVTVDAKGNVNRIPLRLAGPAQIVRQRGGWRLLPATLLLPEGRVEIAGALGPTTTVQARLFDVGLSILQAVSPRLRLGGRGSGTIAYAAPPGQGVPRVTANLSLARLTRAGVASVSLPVDVAMIASLGPAGGDMRAVVRRQGAVVGRVQARLAPLPGTAAQAWTQRLLAAPLAGGVRYNGPAEVLWALSGVEGHELRGPIAVGADFAGRVSEPSLRGVARANDLRYENLAYGTVLDDIRLDSRFTASRFEIASLSATAGRGGRVTGSGAVDLSAERGFPVDIRLQLDDALVANSANLRAVVSGPLRVSNSPQGGARIGGDLRIDSARYRIVRQEAHEVAALNVRRPSREDDEEEAQATLPSIWGLDIRLRASNQLFVEGMGLESEWRARLQVGGNIAEPRMTGPVDLVRGTYSFAGRRFDLTRGAIRFNGGTPADPTLDIAAETTVEDIQATIAIGGTASTPQISFGSSPTRAQDEVLAYLLFGGPVAELSPTEAIQLAAAVNSLRGGGGLNPLGKLRQATGFDRLRILGADDASGRGTALAAGKYIGRNVFVELTTDAQGNTATQLEINLTRTLKLLSQVGAFGSNSVNIRYAKEY